MTPLRADSIVGPLAEDIFPQLRPILEQAITQSPQMLQRGIEIAQSESYVYTSTSPMLPSLSGSSSYTISTLAVASQSDINSRSKGLFYNIGLSQPIYQWGTLKAQADSSKIGVKISEKNYAEAYRTLLLSLRTQYLALIVKKTYVRNSEFSQKVAESNLAATEEKLRSGAISAGEITAYRLAADEARLNKEKYEEDYNNALRYFCHMAGCNEETTEIPAEMPHTIYATDPAGAARLVSRFEHEGMEQTFQAQSYKYQIKQAELAYKVAKYRLYPKFSFSAALSEYNSSIASSSYVSQTGVLSQSVSLTGTWTLFDGFATKGAKLSALAQKRSAERLLKTYQETTLDQVKNYSKLSEFAARALTIAETRRYLSEAAVKRAKDELTSGVGSQATVDTLTVDFYQNEAYAYSARADYLSRQADFVSYLGVDPMFEKLPGRYLAHD